ncbi:hypothetical protein ACKKBG_A06930 [Auxenochlorella protothecoides x Auxenochlorella symbiontica]
MTSPRLAKTLALLLLLAVSTAAKDYYDLLHVSRHADAAAIKRAYRKVALKYHPDKVQGTEEEKQAAAKTFAEIGHAYEVLTDEKKRQIYDQYGEEGLKQMGNSGGGHHNPNDIFAQFFGGFGFGGHGQQEEPQTPKGDDVVINLEVSLEDLYLGRQFKVVRDKGVLKPASGTRKCNCKNRVVTNQVGPGMYQQYTTQVCEDCPNVKIVREREEVTVSVEPGTPDGHRITFFEEGEPRVDGEHGDLIIQLVTTKHPVFERRQSGLLAEMNITLLEALTGFTRELKHLDGHTVAVGSKTVVRPGEQRWFKGEGMPIMDEVKRGDLWVTYRVIFPKMLTQTQQDIIKEVLTQTTWHDEL